MTGNATWDICGTPAAHPWWGHLPEPGRLAPWNEFWAWYQAGGSEHVAAYNFERDPMGGDSVIVSFGEVMPMRLSRLHEIAPSARGPLPAVIQFEII